MFQCVFFSLFCIGVAFQFGIWEHPTIYIPFIIIIILETPNADTLGYLSFESREI